jgi:hypothetical protein
MKKKKQIPSWVAWANLKKEKEAKEKVIQEKEKLLKENRKLLERNEQLFKVGKEIEQFRLATLQTKVELNKYYNSIKYDSADQHKDYQLACAVDESALRLLEQVEKITESENASK